MNPTVEPQKRRKILFAVESITMAQVVRSVHLARALDPAKYEVHFASGHFDELAFAGTDFTRWPLPTIDAAFAASQLEKGKRIYGAEDLRRYVEAELPILEAVQPDVVIGDFRLSLTTSTAKVGVPLATMINAYWSPRLVRDRWPLPDHPMVDLVGDRLAAKYFPKAMPYAFSHFAAPVNDVRKAFGLPAIGGLLDVLSHGDATLWPDAPGMFPDLPAGPHDSFLGPINWVPDMPRDEALDRMLGDPTPLVYVTLGSSGRVDRLPMVLDALARFPVNVVVSTAGRIDDLGNRSPRTLVLPFVPGDVVCRRASLVVSNGGSTTGYQALAEGKPVLGLPSNLDQALASQAIERAGAGLSIRAGAATSDGIARSIDRLLHDEAFSERARWMADHFAQHRCHERFEAFLQRACRDRRRAA